MRVALAAVSSRDALESYEPCGVTRFGLDSRAETDFFGWLEYDLRFLLAIILHLVYGREKRIERGLNELRDSPEL